MYKVQYKSQAMKSLRRVQPKRANSIRTAIKKLAEDPDRKDMNVRPLEGRGGYRLRVGDYRVLFDRDDEIKIISIEKIGPRGDVYNR
ncbi:type II toxin-antitoxin system RelE family toxin [Cohaesibacter celericrescens]|uniref:Type II toxin-antitoxin system RelE/ParE family toxin n=1 Tax=Cohaesibacter celericrescens TaxID=2067669 RepID=A0A2N5XTN9_9HYPH|nr:type II toxin-antitoxin system RelE/ParE family toxin [Cohaesibacter celericrescens]PLW77881.1 type II toxin-antitoxin system RelE/ParE family toxin [Cohaesibacter celericrescens]